MKISIIIPVYDTMKYLGKCINSILKQDFQDIEIICVNDCSKDDSLKILENYKNKDDRIIIVNNKINVGLSQSRNNGIKVASGDYIMFLDSDDYIADGTLMDLYYKINNKNLDSRNSDHQYKIDKNKGEILESENFHELIFNMSLFQFKKL